MNLFGSRQFDAFSAMAGLIVAALGFGSLGDGLGRMINHPSLLWPAVMAVAALLLVVSAVGQWRHRADGGSGTGPAPP